MTAEQIRFIKDMYDKYEIPLYQIAWRRVGDQELALDLVQETFLTMIVRIDKAMTHVNPKAWLFKVLSNLIIRENEKAYHHMEIPFGTEDEVDYTEMRLPLKDLLPQGLSQDEKEILVMRFENQMEYAEIAELKGITQSACRQRVSRAMRHYKDLIHDYAT